MPTGPDQERRQPAQDTPPKPLIAIKTGHETLDRRIGGFSRLIERIKAWPSVAHLLRAAERFNDRLGSQFGAAITYFSFLSLIPILMVFMISRICWRCCSVRFNPANGPPLPSPL